MDDPTDYLSDLHAGNFTGNLAVSCADVAALVPTGTGDISGIILHTYARVVYAGEPASLSAPVFVLPGGNVGMTLPPSGLLGTHFAEVVSALLTTTDGATAWTWANLEAGLAGLAAQVAVLYVGTSVRFDVADFWLDVRMVAGDTTKPIRLTQAIGPVKATQTICAPLRQRSTLGEGAA